MHLAFQRHPRPWLLGYFWGLGHFTSTFVWIREVFILAPLGIASVYAILPAFWTQISRSWIEYISISRNEQFLPKNDPAVVIKVSISPGGMLATCFVFAASWCSFEWCRSWLLSGLPWNQLGVSQWQNEFLLPIVSFTGVYGISFLIVFVNAAIYIYTRRFMKQYRFERAISSVWYLALSVLFIVVIFYLRSFYKVDQPSSTVTVAAVQGNIPQSRVWNPAQLKLAVDTYTSLTRQIVKESKVDLVLWPETAIPASLTIHQDVNHIVKSLLREIGVPLLSGTIDYRYPLLDAKFNLPPKSYNSAVLFGPSGDIIDYYDKIHLVPFGEYVPFEKYLPWLVDWIGMGRSLTAGREYSVIPFAGDVRFGVNICYEDIFPEISARMARRGANVLIIITNDAWFRESSGSRQHLAHSVFRAVENFRPVIRNGNNSDTCLIYPNGEVHGLLYDENGNRFVRTADTYKIPVWQDLPLTFYSKNENWFALLCVGITSLVTIWIIYRYLEHKRYLLKLVQGVEPTSDRIASIK